MDVIQSLLQNPYHFGSGVRNSPEFHDFFEKFKKSFTYQLKRLNATEIEFSKGHFGLSGFFKVNSQYYYFSLSDVRHNLHSTNYDGKINLLMRTAKHNKDYTGGSNNFVTIQNKMYKGIARTFNLEIPERQSRSRGKTTDDYVKEVLDKGYLTKTFSSVRKADNVAFALHSHFGTSGIVTHSKFGRRINSSTVNCYEFTYYCDGQSKRAEYKLGKLSDEQLIKSLKLPDSPEYRINPFTSQGTILEPLAVALHDKIKQWEGSQHDLFSQALLLFRKKYSDAYYVLLD